MNCSLRSDFNQFPIATTGARHNSLNRHHMQSFAIVMGQKPNWRVAQRPYKCNMLRFLWMWLPQYRLPVCLIFYIVSTTNNCQWQTCNLNKMSTFCQRHVKCHFMNENKNVEIQISPKFHDGLGLMSVKQSPEPMITQIPRSSNLCL